MSIGSSRKLASRQAQTPSATTSLVSMRTERSRVSMVEVTPSSPSSRHRHPQTQTSHPPPVTTTFHSDDRNERSARVHIGGPPALSSRARRSCLLARRPLRRVNWTSVQQGFRGHWCSSEHGEHVPGPPFLVRQYRSDSPCEGAMTEPDTQPKKNKTGKPRRPPADVKAKLDPKYDEATLDLEKATRRLVEPSPPDPGSPRR